MKIPILKGIYTNDAADFRTALPRNMIPVVRDTGISDSYLRPTDGIVTFSTAPGPGADRGSINWKGTCYRVMGSKLISIDNAGVITVIGDVGGTTSPVKMDYSFDYLGIISDGNFWLYNGSTLTQNTDPDLGTVLDCIYVDGYFLLTDGEFLIVTELGNPFAVETTKYGSSEVDPDPITGLLKIRNEPYALNRNTIEVFGNIGGSGFPFSRIEGTRIDKGSIGTFTKAWFFGSVAFMGGGRNETPAIWLGLNADTTKISTREVDLILQDYTETQLANVVMEAKVDKSHSHLLIHLPDKTLVYDGVASRVMQRPVWFELASTLTGSGKYEGINHCWAYDKWLVGNSSCCVGYLTDQISSHWEDKVGWEFSTMMLYNEGNGALINELELIGLPGRVALGDDPTIYTSYSLDGQSYSMRQGIKTGTIGDRTKRMIWLRNGHMRNYRIQRFNGYSDAHLTVSALEAQLTGLAY